MNGPASFGDSPDDDPAFVSTGALPEASQVEQLIAEAHRRFASVTEGEVSHVYPALERAPLELFGISVVGTDGEVHDVGDADHEFTIMSIVKPFVFALVCEALDELELGHEIGLDATGMRFNSLAAIERDEHGRTNPMVNPGAIATFSFVPGTTPQQRWDFVVEGLSRFAGHQLEVDEDVFASAKGSSPRNRAVIGLLESYERLHADPRETLDLYTKACTLKVTAHDLATMGATLADGGVQPCTGERVIAADVCRRTLAVMATAGLYERSGTWLYDVGLPAKSGIGGGIVTVSPGKGGLGTFSPPLDPAGNSVRGMQTAQFLSKRLGLDLFLSEPLATSDPDESTDR